MMMTYQAYSSLPSWLLTTDKISVTDINLEENWMLQALKLLKEIGNAIW